MSKLGERDNITNASELIKTNLKRPKVNAEPSGAYFLKEVPRVGQEKIVMFPNRLTVGNLNLFSQSVDEANYVKPE